MNIILFIKYVEKKISKLKTQLNKVYIEQIVLCSLMAVNNLYDHKNDGWENSVTEKEKDQQPK